MIAPLHLLFSDTRDILRRNRDMASSNVKNPYSALPIAPTCLLNLKLPFKVPFPARLFPTTILYKWFYTFYTFSTLFRRLAACYQLNARLQHFTIAFLPLYLEKLFSSFFGRLVLCFFWLSKLFALISVTYPERICKETSMTISEREYMS